MEKLEEQWLEVLNTALLTVNKPERTTPPSRAWRKKMLLAEHSPIRILNFTMTVNNVPSFVATHLSRHHIGVEKFISTRRADRIDKPDLGRLEPVNMKIQLNAQAAINISRKRLCMKASKETRQVWEMIVGNIPCEDVRSVCVPECVYRGFCPEMESCGYEKTKHFEKQLIKYRNERNNN